MTKTSMTRHELMLQLAAARERLRKFGIRDAGDYAEVLVAEALAGQRLTSRVNKGHDVMTKKHGRVEVKCRQLPFDGRIEQRVAIGASKKEGFESLAIVIFHHDFSVKGAVIVPYASVWKFTSLHKYNRISYQHACKLQGAKVITAALKKASNK